MSTFLFNEIIFGPVHSRRLGVSLGINLLPVNKKYCNFNCIYCECGWSHLQKVVPGDIPSRVQVSDALRNKLNEMKNAGNKPDVITYAGNGEPAMHPDFAGIISDSIEIRDELCPDAEIAVLTNASLIHREEIAEALAKADQNILKLDTVNPEIFRMLNCPSPGINIGTIIENLARLKGRKIIQSMFVRGEWKGKVIDNSGDEEVNGLIRAYRKIQPDRIMVYTFARDTAAEGLKKVSLPELNRIAGRIREAGFWVEVSG